MTSYVLETGQADLERLWRQNDDGERQLLAVRAGSREIRAVPKALWPVIVAALTKPDWAVELLAQTLYEHEWLLSHSRCGWERQEDSIDHVEHQAAAVLAALRSLVEGDGDG